jgi:streptogramin lyase
MKCRHVVVVAAAVTLGAGVAWLPGLPAFASGASTYTYTTTGDFAGPDTTVLNLATSGDELKLTPSYTFPFVWMPASNRGTIIKIDATAGAIVGEYRSAPLGMGQDPSRTTVDKNGNVWATNRQEASGGMGSVVHIGLAEAGQCTDRNGNGVIDTSHGLGDIKAWTNAGGADTTGGVNTAEDECVIGYVRTHGTNARTVAVAADNTVWVGGYGSWSFDQIGQDHQIVAGSTFSSPLPAYGGFVDAHGILWSSAGPGTSGVLRYDTTTHAILGVVPVPVPYGLGLDPYGNVWASTYGDSALVYKISSAGAIVGTYPVPDAYNRGVTFTSDGDAWIVNTGSGYVTRLSNAGALKAHIYVGSTPTGVSVDANGKVWVSVYGQSLARRIDPATNGVDLTVDLGAGAYPYTYGDMTGSVLVGGPTSGSWTKIIDGGLDGQHWSSIDWTAEDCGGGVNVTAAASTDAISWGPGMAVTNSGELGLSGRYLKVTVELTRSSGTDPTPVVFDLSVTTNQPPTADAGLDQAVSEGTLVSLDGSASSDPDSDALSYAWTLKPDYTGPAVTLSDPNVVSPTFATTDNGFYAFVLEVSDGHGGTASDGVQVSVSNLDPVITGFTTPDAPVAIGAPVGLSATFTDAGTADTHTAQFSVGGTDEFGLVTETNGSGSASASLNGLDVGVYTATVTITDDDTGTATASAAIPVVIYDPSAGFVTGGGWITSPAGAYSPDATLAGKATFGFVSKYQKGATVPTGATEFVFHAAGMTFSSTSYDWLVVSGTRAQYKGTGVVTGTGTYDGTYKFILTALDGGTSPDLFRMKILHDDDVLYDNQMSAPDGATPATALSGGSIVIHVAKK